MSVRAGAATRVINPEIGDDLAGQLHRRFANYIRDDLEANFLYLTEGSEQMLLVSLDLLGIITPDGLEMREKMAAASGVPAEKILLCCTHTHSGPVLRPFIHDAPDNTAYRARLADWLADGAREAVASAVPARVGWGKGQAQIGFNRRLCWADGTHTMYGEATRPDFTGLEGPDDPSHAILYAVDESGKYLALVHNNSCHPVNLGGSDFVTADFPGEARAQLRMALENETLPVLYLQGASGDQTPQNQLWTHWSGGEQRMREMGHALATETLRLLHDVVETDTPGLRQSFELLPLEVRLPTEEELAEARAIEAQGDNTDGRGYTGNRWDYVIAVAGRLRLWETYKDDPHDELPIHALRIGDLAIITNPCELYCQFALDMKRRSRAEVTMVTQLANGSVGYCPTIPAIMGGGYSGWAIMWTRLEPYAGYKLVETSCRMLNDLWQA